MSSPISRRAALGGLAVVLAGCASPGAGSRGPSSAPETSGATAEFAALEARMGGRLGVHALDTGSGAGIGYRADERFLMCSTSKVLTSGAILRRAEQDPRCSSGSSAIRTPRSWSTPRSPACT